MIALFVVLGIAVAGVAALLVGLMYLGTVSPETSVYKGEQVPGRFIETLREVGALEPGERVLYFYSDGLTDVREGFYFVSDRKVCVYIEAAAEPLATVGFDEIAEAELTRDTSFFVDSQILLYLHDGDTLWFPVSSEMDRDEVFHRAILDRIDG